MLLLVLLLFVPAPRAVEWRDLPEGVRGWLAERGIGSRSFAEWRSSLDRATEERIRAGEEDELVHYFLQSRTFTDEPRIEPALSAEAFMESSGAVPPAVVRRIDAFLAALRGSAPDGRLREFRTRRGVTRESLLAAYRRTMRFLYRKEFGHTDVAGLYRERGHSTDTRIEANFAVWTALAVLRELAPAARASRILIVGPGLDFAPRTALFDDVPPQSYQPFAIADALLATGFAGADWRIHCIDINPRVVRFIESFHLREDRRLVLLKPAAGEEFQTWFAHAGAAIGDAAPLPAGKSIAVRADVAARITAGKLNILTNRYDPPPGYDLAVATNVLLYFGNEELALALSNLRAMMQPGGYLVHNELRPELDALAPAAGFAPVQARTVRFSAGLYDAFAIYRAK